MPAIGDLIKVLTAREGVEATVLVGRDGLLIDGRSAGDLDPERLAALTPNVMAAADGLAEAAARGSSISLVIEYERGTAIVMSLGSDALLLVLVRNDADVSGLLYELRRHRANIAAIV